jgi:hypothetical protein
MPRKSKQPQRVEDPAIVERHDAVFGEVALSRCPGGWFRIEFITPRLNGGFDRKSLLFGPGRREKFANRMSDMLSGIIAAQHQAGLSSRRAA